MADTKYPELEKIKAIRDKSQAIGEFIDWIYGTKKYFIAQDIKEPYEKFSEEMSEREVTVPIVLDVNKLLVEFFGIDEVKAEKERVAILEDIRRQNNA